VPDALGALEERQVENLDYAGVRAVGRGIASGGAASWRVPIARFMLVQKHVILGI
jgi:hypothetical protein